MHYIIVGADKCGTDALRYHLNLHEEIYCDSTERHFFSQNKKIKLFFTLYYSSSFVFVLVEMCLFGSTGTRIKAVFCQ